MTAEIAVMNREAVALAADSAVTLDFSSGPKIFSSANKIFALSGDQPVGVMVFGGASFVGMPWETIIKEVRVQLGSIALASVSAYNDRFFEELLLHDAFAGPVAQRRSFDQLVGEAYRSVLGDFLNAAEKEIEDRSALSKKELSSLLARQIQRHRKAWQERRALPDVAEDFSAKICRKYAAKIKSLRERVFEQLPLSKVATRELTAIAGLIFTREAPAIADLSYSGIVIAGFGREEYFPHLVRQRVYGVVDGSLRIEGREELEIEYENDACIAPFAQREMVDAFIQGLEPGYGFQAERATRKLADELIAMALEAAGSEPEERDELKASLDDGIKERFKSLEAELKRIRNERNVLPIIEVVSALPKDELAAMAESLVNLTSFKRRVSKSAETVGGPIDVAVISRGDGFVWIKRKHYFPRELNPRYLANLEGKR